MKKVLIIYDSSNPEKRRTCFWEKLKSSFDSRELSFRFVSILELLTSGNPATELFDKNKTDAIIINWDAINTDPVYGSDRAHGFFNHYIADMDRWVRQGGVIIIEEQGASARLVQSACDSFTYDASEMERKYPILVNRNEAVGSAAYKNLKKRDHPLLDRIPNILNLEHAALYRENWFPEEYIKNLPSLIDYETYKNRMYSGCFISYNKSWQALLFEDRERRYPVLLCRLVKGNGTIGAYVLTTMYLASSELINLVENAINLPTSSPRYLESLAEKESKKKLLVTVFCSIAIIVGTMTYLQGLPAIFTIISATLSGAIGGVVAHSITKLTARRF